MRLFFPNQRRVDADPHFYAQRPPEWINRPDAWEFTHLDCCTIIELQDSISISITPAKLKKFGFILSRRLKSFNCYCQRAAITQVTLASYKMRIEALFYYLIWNVKRSLTKNLKFRHYEIGFRSIIHGKNLTYRTLTFRLSEFQMI